MFSDLSLTLGEDQFVDSHGSLAELACQGTINRGDAIQDQIDVIGWI